MDRDRSYANAVVRACDVLKAFRHEREAVSLAELVDRTQLSKTTVFRLLQSLARGGLMERVGKGVYSSRIRPLLARTFRLGFAAQTDSEFSREVTASLERAAVREQVHLITVNNRYSAREALRNADLLIRERVDLVLEFQTYERVAPIVASKFLEANIPVIAIGRCRNCASTASLRDCGKSCPPSPGFPCEGWTAEAISITTSILCAAFCAAPQ
jgi:ribose transport system substrate-binding protein